MRFGVCISAFVVLLMGWICCAFGHGARCTVIEGGMSVEAVYHDGSPMSFCDVEVFRPGDEEAYQVGTTDPLGRFAFVPDTTGAWTVAVDDAMGHRATEEIDVQAAGVKVGRDAGMSRIHGVVVGVSVIFGVFGLFSLFYRRSREAR